jgi:hypothetical protein
VSSTSENLSQTGVIGKQRSQPKSILKGENSPCESEEKEEEECSSDTGLSSLSTSTDEGTYALTTLV